MTRITKYEYSADIDKALWLANHCDPESAFEIQLGKAIKSLVQEIDTLRMDLELTRSQRSAAFRKIEQMQDAEYGAIKVAMGDLADSFDKLNRNPFTEVCYANEVANVIRQRFGIDKPNRSKEEDTEEGG